MSETAKTGFQGQQRAGFSLHADSTVVNANDLASEVSVGVKVVAKGKSNANYTICFTKPGPQASFQQKHTRRIRSGSVTELQGKPYQVAEKITSYNDEASKRAGTRWENDPNRLNTLIFLTLEGYCKLAAYIVDQIAVPNWHPFGPPNNQRQQMHLNIVMSECLAFSDNGYGQPTNTGVGVQLQATVEQDQQNANILYVVHLANAPPNQAIGLSTHQSTEGRLVRAVYNECLEPAWLDGSAQPFAPAPDCQTMRGLHFCAVQFWPIASPRSTACATYPDCSVSSRTQ